jgi:hypothetical protein
MISELMRGAHWLDAWLREHLGRPYIALLGVGLTAGIIADLKDVGQVIGSSVGLLKVGALVVFQLALLVNQLAQFHDYRQERQRRREKR